MARRQAASAGRGASTGSLQTKGRETRVDQAANSILAMLREQRGQPMVESKIRRAPVH